MDKIPSDKTTSEPQAQAQASDDNACQGERAASPVETEDDLWCLFARINMTDNFKGKSRHKVPPPDPALSEQARIIAHQDRPHYPPPPPLPEPAPSERARIIAHQDRPHYPPPPLPELAPSERARIVAHQNRPHYPPPPPLGSMLPTSPPLLQRDLQPSSPPGATFLPESLKHPTVFDKFDVSLGEWIRLPNPQGVKSTEEDECLAYNFIQLGLLQDKIKNTGKHNHNGWIIWRLKNNSKICFTEGGPSGTKKTVVDMGGGKVMCSCYIHADIHLNPEKSKYRMQKSDFGY